MEDWQRDALHLFKGDTTIREVAEAVGKPPEEVEEFFAAVVMAVAHDLQRSAGWM
jgi:hypothetical protein